MSPRVPFDWNDVISSVPDPKTEADFASLRTLGKTTIGKSFPMQFGHTDDIGQPTRTVWQVISEDAGRRAAFAGEGEEALVHESATGKVQVKARIVREAGRIVEIRFERVTGRSNQDAKLERLLNLDEAASARLIELCLALRGIDPSEAETLRIDGTTLSAVLEQPGALSAAYASDPTSFAAVIEGDVEASDVVAIASRRRAVTRFEELLEDEAAFEAERGGKSAEAVWQRFFEQHPWLLGVGLSGQLLTAYDPSKLERYVAGHSVAASGKRVDALLTTAGIVRSLVFAEFKRHDDALVESREYRPGTWAPGAAVVGGAAQVLMTVDRARDDLGVWLRAEDDDGYATGEEIFSGAPRSYLIVGTLKSLTKDGRMHPDKVRSFELYRRNHRAPEILTYDEVLARAKWSLETTTPHAD